MDEGHSPERDGAGRARDLPGSEGDGDARSGERPLPKQDGKPRSHDRHPSIWFGKEAPRDRGAANKMETTALETGSPIPDGLDPKGEERTGATVLCF